MDFARDCGVQCLILRLPKRRGFGREEVDRIQKAFYDLNANPYIDLFRALNLM